MVREGAGGFAMKILTEGTPNVPLAMEITLSAAARVEGVSPAPGVELGRAFVYPGSRRCSGFLSLTR